MTEPFIEPIELVTGHLRLRIPQDADAADALLMLRDPDVDKWYPAPSVVDDGSALEWCRRGATWSQGNHATFTIVDEVDGRLVGNVSLTDIDRLDQCMAAIAYRVAPWSRNRGVASAAVVAVTSWAFGSLGIERVTLEHSLGNPASCRVAHKSGYVFEGLLRAGFRNVRGERHDVHLHARLAEDSEPTR